MGYPSLNDVVQSARQLSLQSGETATPTLRRSKGLWHVLVFLRYRRLNGMQQEYTLGSRDLASASFDLLGVTLPISSNDRDVYFEPAATGGTELREFFRQPEAPRQTIMNRIQTGLSGQGPNKPRLFAIDGETLPITVSLVDDWVRELRAYPANVDILDDHLRELLIWLFRFGIPEKASVTSSVARHIEGESMELETGLQFRALPASPAELRPVVADYLGLTDSQMRALFPTFDSLTTWS